MQINNTTGMKRYTLSKVVIMPVLIYFLVDKIPLTKINIGKITEIVNNIAVENKVVMVVREVKLASGLENVSASM